MKETCPGSAEIRKPYPEDLMCVFCGFHNEVWSDEFEINCKGCGKEISRDMKPSCLEWCPSAKECVGADKYERLMKAVRKAGR
jgi:hypothetical protein